MNWPPRIIAVLSLIQIFFVVSSYLITRSCMKIYDRVMPQIYGGHAYPRSGIAEFVRNWGLWILLIPIAWCIFASARSRWEHSESSLSSAQFIGGIALTLGVALLFSAGAMRAVEIAIAGR